MNTLNWLLVVAGFTAGAFQPTAIARASSDRQREGSERGHRRLPRGMPWGD